MKSFIVFALFVAAAAAAPAASGVLSPDANAVVLKNQRDNIGIDGYNFNVETSNGIRHEEDATLKNAGTENEAIEVRGQYSYTGPDGVVYTVTYIANEGGFQPQGAHIPQAS